MSVVLGLGLERVCPWPWPRNFFVSLALASVLASSLESSTPPLVICNEVVLLKLYLSICSNERLTYTRIFFVSDTSTLLQVIFSWSNAT